MDSNRPSSGELPTEGETRGVVDTLPRVETPRLYKVLLLNDDFTPMDFVIVVLKRFFSKNEQDAQRIMLDVHHQGTGVAGVFTLETAEMKVMQVNHFARQNQHPLKSTLEPD
ncbi:MAG: ATP-dependent Clp protease adapter ClpS [Bdellovibrio sp.]|nr:MAG: ATP-dependent Clp protease adapter ClpS [Bdellovibrio sp.]